MNYYSHRSLIDVTLNDIHAKYGIKSVPLLLFRNRVYEGKMIMEQALTKPPGGRALSKAEYNIYISMLYTKLCILTKPYVSRPHFVVKMSQGYAPEEAIKKKPVGGDQSKTAKTRKAYKIRKTPKVKNIITSSKKQKQKETLISKVKKVRPFTAKEQKYISNLDILNNAFNKINNKHLAGV